MWFSTLERGLFVSDQYYASAPASPSRQVPCTFLFHGHAIACQTDAGVFSKGELDEGTALLLHALPELSGPVLDVGCGWGPLGVAIGKAFPTSQVTMLDVNQRALSLARDNAARHRVQARILESDGYAALPESEKGTYQAIITNPPIRAGKAVVYRILSEAAQWLAPQGTLYLVIRKQQGADSALKHLRTWYRQVAILERSHGFRVISACDPSTDQHGTTEEEPS
mgnify:CR=1 FL=1